MTSNQHILIVDDQPDNILILERTLHRAGYVVSGVRSGQAALDFVAHTLPDLVLLDIMMPEMDGYITLQHIRANAALSFIPVMFLSAMHTVADTVTGLDHGADDYLVKPYNSDELLARIRMLLRLKDTRRALQREQEHLSLLYQVSQTLHRSLDVDQVLAQTLHTIGDVLGATRGSVFLLDSQGRVWRKITFRPHLPPAEVEQAVRAVLREGLAAHALHTGKVQIVTDAANDSRWKKFPNDTTLVGSALALPLRNHINAHMEGVLVLIHPQPNHFAPTIEPLVTALADQISVALANASVYTRLREAEDSRESFIQMLTHDLRSPLAGMIGCFDALNTTTLDADGQLFVELGFRAGAVQQRLIDDLLDVYKAEAGSLALNLDPTSLAHLGALLQQHLGASTVDAGLTLILDLPKTPILLDEHKMTRVLSNLVSNAIKWTRPGGSIVVRGALNAVERTLTISVTDTGRGITSDDVPHIFDKFYQGRAHGARPGTGLGLTFCALVMAAHGGSIAVESTLGIGTTMILHLPWKE